MTALATLRTRLSDENSKWAIILRLLPVVVFAAVLIRSAWMSDDAYITLRTVDNVVNGYGLRWNIVERVQSYSHPLWMFLLSAGYAITREAYFTSLVIAGLVSLAAVVFFVLRIAPSPLAAIVGGTILFVSKSFVDFSTSGLENPLTHLLLLAFYALYLTTDRAQSRRLFWLSLLAALIATNRQDAILLVLPALIAAWWHSENRIKAVISVALGFLPLAIWEIFSILYYGFPFPNTAYAKLNTGLDQALLTRQGLFYYPMSFQLDPLTMLVIAAGLILPIIRRRWDLLPALIGITLYLVYIVRIGGDFMAGRFFVAPMLVALVALMALDWKLPDWGYGGLIAGVLILGMILPYSPLRFNPTTTVSPWMDTHAHHGIVDEKGFYYPCTGLWSPYRGLGGPENPARCTVVVVWWPSPYRPDEVVEERSTVGFGGFYLGPEKHIVDELALSDPLLARLPVVSGDCRVGHYRRGLPGGYKRSLRNGEVDLDDQALNEYYGHLWRVVRDPIFSPDRLRSIWMLNTGQLDHLLPQSDGTCEFR